MKLFSKGVIEAKLEEVEVYSNKDGHSLIFDLDKLIPREAIKTGVDIYKGYFIDTYACPKCARPVGDEVYVFSYCPNCGQRMKKE